MMARHDPARHRRREGFVVAAPFAHSSCFSYLTGEALDGVRLLGGVMFLNPILTKTQGNATDGWMGAKGKLLVARFEVNNVIDASYRESGGGSNLLNLGAPPSFRVSLTTDF